MAVIMVSKGNENTIFMGENDSKNQKKINFHKDNENQLYKYKKENILIKLYIFSIFAT